MSATPGCRSLPVRLAQGPEPVEGLAGDKADRNSIIRKWGPTRSLALFLGVVLLLSSAGAQTPVSPNDHAEERQVLEKDLARFYALIQQDDDPASKTTFRGYHQEYMRRATLLMQSFDPKKYDDLRYDIN